jgi:hypothetical protein
MARGPPGREAGGWRRLRLRLPRASSSSPGGRAPAGSWEAAWGRRRRGQAGPGAAGESAGVPDVPAAPLSPGSRSPRCAARTACPARPAAGSAPGRGRGRSAVIPAPPELRAAGTSQSPRGTAEAEDPRGAGCPRTAAARGNHRGWPGGSSLGNPTRAWNADPTWNADFRRGTAIRTSFLPLDLKGCWN